MSILRATPLREHLGRVLALQGPLSFLREPGAWWWLALGLGALLRFFLLESTEGTYDASIWQRFGRGVAAHGLIEEYHRAGGGQSFNHPPPIGLAVGSVHRLASALGLPFALVWRLPFALLDAGSAALLFRLCGSRPERYLVTASYWLSPLALVYSAYHGNSDSAIGFALLVAVHLAARGRGAAAGAVLGASTWIKLPGLLGAPALGLALPSWRQRLAFAAAAAGVAGAGYLPALMLDPGIVLERVLTYGGQVIHTTGGVFVWGPRSLVPLLGSVPDAVLVDALRWHDRHARGICLGLVALVACARRHERGVHGLARTLSLCFAVLYGLSPFWSFQYLAWSLPLWLLSGAAFAVPALALGSLYVYGLYAWLTGSPLLLGPWDFVGHPTWPGWLLWLRSATYLFFLGVALGASGDALARLYREARAYLAARRARAD